MGIISDFWGSLWGDQGSPDEQISSLIGYTAASQFNENATKPSWYSEGHWLHDAWEDSAAQTLLLNITHWLAESLPEGIANFFQIGDMPKIQSVSEELSTTPKDIGNGVEKAPIDQATELLLSSNSLPKDVNNKALYSAVLSQVSANVNSPITGWTRLAKGIFSSGDISKEALNIAQKSYDTAYETARLEIAKQYLSSQDITFDPNRIDELISGYPQISSWASSVAEEVSGLQMDLDTNNNKTYRVGQGGIYANIVDGVDNGFQFAGSITSPPTTQLADFTSEVLREKASLQLIQDGPFGHFADNQMTEDAKKNILSQYKKGANIAGGMDTQADADSFTRHEQEQLSKLKQTNPALYAKLQDLLKVVPGANGGELHNVLESMNDIDLGYNSDGVIEELTIQAPTGVQFNIQANAPALSS